MKGNPAATNIETTPSDSLL